MASADDTIVIGIELDDGSIKKAVIKANDLQDKIGGAISSGVDKSLTGLITQIQFVGKIAGKAFGVVADGIGKAVDEASKADSALAKFNATLANAGGFSEQASQDFQSFAESLQRVGTVSDDAVIDAASNLVAIGGLTGDALKQATQAAVDLSAGLQKDLGSSFDLVAKAAAGNTEVLSRYGIKVSENIPENERFAEALRLINERFGGLDATKANTFEGAVTKLGIAIDDVFENIGKLITQNPQFVGVINYITKQINKLSETIKKSFTQDSIKAFINNIFVLGQSIIDGVIRPIEALGRGATFVINVLRTGFQGIVALVAKFSVGIGSILLAVGAIDESQFENLTNFADSSKTLLTDLANKTKDSFLGIFNSDLTNAAQTAFNNLKAAADAADPLSGLKNNNKAALAETANDTKKTVDSIMNIIKNGLVRTISQGVQTVVGAVAKGQNAFKALGSAVFNIMGDIAIQIGETLLLTGLGIESLRKSITNLVGGPAIAAGIALIAFGALLKSLSGGGSTGGTAAPGEATGAPGGGVTPTEQVSAEPTAVERDTRSQVTVNIEGNVLDRRETGLEIANVLQEYFDTNDGVLARA